MHKFVRSLITEWRKLSLPVKDNAIVVAVSGGADSMSLLAAIADLTKRKKLHVRVIVSHFNHGLRGSDSDLDEAFVQDHAAGYGFESIAGRGGVPGNRNIEENARRLRYRYFEHLAKTARAFAVVTAHTLNDQAETLLINLVRGSGANGLSAMKPVRPLSDDVLLIRPLLSWASRSDTEEFCRECGIDFRHDSMNDDPRFTRTRIRKQVLPLLAELNPNIVETLARTAQLLDHADSAHPAGVVPPISLELKEVRGLRTKDLYRTLREWLRSNRGSLRSLELKHIEAIERLIHSRKSGKTVELPGGGRVVKERGRVFFRNIKVEK